MKQKPNIILYLADDLGYGDISCLNKDSKIHTENIDALARDGICFSDAHASSSVCTPSRYGVLTGRYNWRSRLKSGVLPGCGSPLIEEGRMTIGSMLQQEGYNTAAVGKWHLGMDWPIQGGGYSSAIGDRIDFDATQLDYSAPIKDGPITRGFDYFFGMAGSLDQAPYTFIENDHVTQAPDHMVGIKGFVPLNVGEYHPEHIGYGPAAPDYNIYDVVPRMHDKVFDLITEYAKDDKPFFIYSPSPAVHGPLAPAKEYVGKSGIGLYGDFVLQVDDFIGKLSNRLEELNIADNTIVIFASDNGCSPIVDFEKLIEQGHNPSYHFRGAKFDIWEGGHRIPLIVKWPKEIKGGAVCDQIVCLTDLFATIAEIVGCDYGQNAGEDSISNLSLWRAEDKCVREAVVHHSRNGMYSVRKGKWKLEFCAGSGGQSFPVDGKDDTSGLPPMQLYDLTQDVSERENLILSHPDVMNELRELMMSYIVRGRSTPGEEQANSPGPAKWPGLHWMNL